MIRVLIVEDSATVREFLVAVLRADPQIEVVGTARNGEEALEAVMRLQPDLVTMDIVMPRLGGLEATRRIMERRPTPIVIVSAYVPSSEAQASFEALEAGALAVVPRPVALQGPAHAKSAAALIRTVKLMAEVKVVRRWASHKPASTGSSEFPAVPRLATAPADRPLVNPNPGSFPQKEALVVAIGGSTGAPGVLHTLLSLLPRDYALPVLVVQHMAPGFIDGFAEWLTRATGFKVAAAVDGELLRPGQVYLAPDHRHMGLRTPGQIALSDSPPEQGLRPSVAHLFRSAALCFGGKGAGVLLSGMGEDGAAALKLWRERGALTIVQDPRSSVVNGMPGAAARLGAAEFILPPESIAARLAALKRPMVSVEKTT